MIRVSLHRAHRWTLAVLVLAGCAWSLVVAAEPAQPRAADLAWLTGCWASGTPEEGSEECWLPPRNGLLLGLNRSWKGDRVAFEYLRIAEEEGTLVYHASPGGGPSTPFRWTAGGPGSATFENPEHDFPQRLVYRLEGDELRARVEAEAGERGFELVWQKRPGLE
jgi:hypothetical protein